MVDLDHLVLLSSLLDGIKDLDFNFTVLTQVETTWDGKLKLLVKVT